jgi:H+-translocating NAD(P) transhydrogenase subunit beta
MTGRPITYAGQQIVNGLIALSVVGVAGALIAGYASPMLFIALVVAASLLGVLAVLPIGGADMPVVISLLNSFTGVAVAITGFVLGNDVLIISGALVGASGTLLTMLMAKAMNRSIGNVLFGAFGAVHTATGGAAASATGAASSVRTASVEDVATMCAYARSVIIAPGYGMAVAQAQHAVRELAGNLEKRGVDVQFAIHPVAGRMPGHMNVLLAEANVPYSQLHEMDEINPQFEHCDVVLVIGANDVTNPAARNVPSSPIFGMPILDVDKAKAVIVLKRSMNPGFAGIDNPLYENPKCAMLFGDAKDTVSKLAAAIPLA